MRREPDADGLFDFAGVAEIARRRATRVTFVSPLPIDLADKQAKTHTLTAIAPGKWDPVPIIAARKLARDDEVYDVDMATAKVRNEYGLDERKIARIVGADEVRPYLSRRSRYFRNADDPDHLIRPWYKCLAEGWPAVVPRVMENAYPGEPTWAPKLLMWSPEVCRALRSS
jgi:hypothetical protein